MDIQYEITVIIPTFNEEANIADIIEAVNSTFLANNICGGILVVDDESRDKTIEIVQNLTLEYNNLKIIVRHAGNNSFLHRTRFQAHTVLNERGQGLQGQACILHSRSACGFRSHFLPGNCKLPLRKANQVFPCGMQVREACRSLQIQGRL